MGQVNRKHISVNRSRSIRSIRIFTRSGSRSRTRAFKDSSTSTIHSHTFTCSNNNTDNVYYMIDVNIATEETLMTVSGITRELANHIVEHRNTIGRFRKIDDLALVSGMGADKLNEIRSEICIGRRKTDSDSATQSLDSVWSSESDKCPLDINSVSVFRLQCVPGLDQELAANIIDYRRKKGYFKSLDDLIKVKGIDIIRLGAIKRHLMIGDYDHEKNIQILNELKMLKNGMNGHIKLNGSCVAPLTPGHRKSSSMPSRYTQNFSNGYNLSPVDDIFDLLSAYSRRPILEDYFQYQRDNRPAIRIATWNLEQLSVEKAMNPGFREVVCRTILENRISILCIQEVLTVDVLQIICKELNAPYLKRVREWKDNHKQWRYLFKPSKYDSDHNFGYIYEDDYRNDINIVEVSSMKFYPSEDDSAILDDSSNKSITFDTSQGPNFNRDITEFKINDKHFGLLNINLTNTNTEYRTTLICELIDELASVYNNLTVVGTFHSTKNLGELSSCYKSVIDPHCNTSVESSMSNKKCGILIPNNKDDIYANHSGIIRIGLNHLAIPQGWSWGGPASSHCPIWAEFFT